MSLLLEPVRNNALFPNDGLRDLSQGGYMTMTTRNSEGIVNLSSSRFISFCLLDLTLILFKPRLLPRKSAVCQFSKLLQSLVPSLHGLPFLAAPERTSCGNVVTASTD